MSASPTNLGLEAAAKKLTPLFVGPATLEGKTTRGMGTQITVVFAPEMLEAGEPRIGKAKWTSMPTAAQMAEGLPTNLSTITSPTIRVRLNCLVGAGGKVSDCRIEGEDPVGHGLGAAAIAWSKYFELSIWTEEGLPTIGGRVIIPIRYELSGLQPAAGKP